MTERGKIAEVAIAHCNNRARQGCRGCTQSTLLAMTVKQEIAAPLARLATTELGKIATVVHKAHSFAMTVKQEIAAPLARLAMTELGKIAALRLAPPARND